MIRRLALCLLALGALEAEARAAEPPTVVWEVVHDGGPIRSIQVVAAMAFDEARNQTVAFAARETWLWNGSKWLKAHPTFAPPSDGATMAYDRARARAVMISFNGQNNETWEWNGTTWSKSANAAPDGQLVYDENLAKVIAVSEGKTQTETWAWNGSSWTQLAPAHSPPVTVWGCLGYDPVRRRAVMFGGHVGFNEVNDTWEWDGVDWSQASPAHAPPTRVACTLGFTGTSMLLYGGVTNNTGWNNTSWNWDGVDWSLSSSATFPVDKTSPSFAFDSVRSRLVLFGGTPNSSPGPFDDTLEFDGSVWLDRTVHDHPLGSGVWDAMVYDDALGKMVLVDWTYRETWLWSGTTWTSLPTAHFPDGASGRDVVYDRSRSRLVAVTMNPTGTWEFDGIDWIHRQPATTTPDARLLAYDTKRARTVALSFGGTPATWEWDGTDWSLRQSGNAGLSFGSSMAFDEARGVTVLAGKGSGPTNQTWTWDGLSWTKKNPATNPVTGPLAYDPVRKRLISIASDSWSEWDGVDWATIDQSLPPDTVAGVGAFAFDRGRNRFTAYADHHYATWELHMRGGVCATGSECDSQICEDGTCCETTCGGANDCMACSKAAGALDEGLCGVAAITTVCRPNAAACDEVEACDGVSGACPGDGFALLGKVCAAPRCDGNAYVGVAFCTGGSAACPPAVTTPCAPYVCKDGTGCATSCETSAECVDGTTCDRGRCVPPAADAGADASSSDSLSMGGGGCGCEAAGRSRPSPAAATIAATLAALAARRRRRGRR